MIGVSFALALAVVSVQQGKAGIDERAIEGAIEKGRQVQASDMIEHARKSIHPSDEAALLRLEGMLALSQSRNGDAFLAFTRSAEHNSDDCRTSEGMGIAALRLGQNRAAMASLKRAIEHCPDRWRAWNALGVAYDKDRDWIASEAAYDKAAALMPGNVQIANNRGYSLILQHRFDEAAKLLGEEVARVPDNLRVKFNLDIALVAAGKLPVPRQTNETNDDWSIRLNNAGYVAYLSGRPEDARRFFNEAIVAHSTPFAIAIGNAELVGRGSDRP